MKFSLIIPAKNEEKRILLPLLEYYHALFTQLGPKAFEIIVVINNTTDSTQQVISWLKHRIGAPEIVMLNAGNTQGKGEAVLEGFKRAKGKIVGFIDADGSSSQHELMKLYNNLISNSSVDVAIASRYMDGGNIIGARPIHRVLASKTLHKIIHFMFDTRFEDFFCGLKLFKRRVVPIILKETKILGWAFDVNIMLSLERNGYSVKEFPTEWEDRSNSKVNIFKYGGKVLKDLFALKQIYSSTQVIPVPNYTGSQVE